MGRAVQGFSVFRRVERSETEQASEISPGERSEPTEISASNCSLSVFHHRTLRIARAFCGAGQNVGC
jgi:hypothetical protein